jgi:hypothetical protein
VIDVQISDLLGQYNRNTNQNVSIAAPTPGVQKLVEAVRELTVGNVFEGTVNDIKRGQVILGLSNGETVIARMAGNLSLSVGQSMFFQVKSNNGSQIEIRPYTSGNFGNPTLLKALDAAGIPVSARSINMVNSMMEESMAIDKQSLWNMARTVAEQSDVDVATIVQMKKLDIPVTPSLAAQFQNYTMNQSAITGQMQSFVEELPGALSNDTLTQESAWNLNSKILDTLLAELGDVPSSIQDTGAAITASESAEIQQGSAATAEGKPGEVTNPTASMTTPVNAEPLVVMDEKGQPIPTDIKLHVQEDYPEHTLGRVLDNAQMDDLNQLFKEFPKLLQNSKLFTEGVLNPKLTVSEVLTQLQKSMSEEVLSEDMPVKKLLASKSYQSLLRDVMEQEWMLKPTDLQQDDKINDLYQRLDRQMNRLEEVFRQTGQDGTNLAKAAGDVRGNVEFINQLNQVYQYVQVPLKMSGQNAQGDLYVYTNKKNLADQEGDLTAFLHLDMEHLGSTDVSVRMHNKQVHTEFYLADDKAYQLLMENIGQLQARLESKGYDCSIQVNNQEKKVDFVEDFLKKDQPATGRVHRYSFDVRA